MSHRKDAKNIGQASRVLHPLHTKYLVDSGSPGPLREDLRRLLADFTGKLRQPHVWTSAQGEVGLYIKYTARYEFCRRNLFISIQEAQTMDTDLESHIPQAAAKYTALSCIGKSTKASGPHPLGGCNTLKMHITE